MLINKAYKFKLYPSKEQEILINKTFGCTRLVYNHYLNKKQELYKQNHITLSSYDMCKDLKVLSNEKPYLKEVDSIALRTSIFDLDDAYIDFLKLVLDIQNIKRKMVKIVIEPI